MVCNAPGYGNPDSKVHGANMEPIWVLSAQDGPMLAPWTLLSGKTVFPGVGIPIIKTTALLLLNLESLY